jgi:diacylglycerol kinase family enzyme
MTPSSPADAPSPPRSAGRLGVRTAVVANPSKMTRPDAVRAVVTQVLAEHGWPTPLWLETTRSDPGGGQTRSALAAGADVLIAAGGDGTVRACVEHLVGTDTALAILPFGTGNLLATNLGVPARTKDALSLVTSGQRRRLDVGVLGDRPFVVMAGIGLDALMLRDAPETLKRRIGWPAYLWAAARHLCEPPMTLTLRVDDGRPVTRRARMLLIGNVGRLQGGIPVLPGARPDDGLLDIALLMPPRRLSWIPLAWALLRQQPTPPLMELFRANRLHVTSPHHHLCELDGELLTAARTLTATIRPSALWVCAHQPMAS